MKALQVDRARSAIPVRPDLQRSAMRIAAGFALTKPAFGTVPSDQILECPRRIRRNAQQTISGIQMEFIENRTFDEINVGDTALLERTLTEQDIRLFAVMSGDINPAHVDPEYAMSSRFREVIGHGMWSGALISTVLGTVFPGPGTIYLGQNLRFRRPVKVGDTITVKVTAKEKTEKGNVVLDTECVNQDGEVVVSGSAEVIAPTEKVRRP